MLKYHTDIIQGTPEWHAARCGLLTASEMKNILTPAKLQYAQNNEERSHLYDLLAQRITNYVEPHYVSDDMLRGKDDELDAKRYYEDACAKVNDCGFITNDRFGFMFGYSPDGLVGDDGQIEVKGRRQKRHVETILGGKMPDDYLIQVQTGLLVSERKWCDFISFCGGLPMFILRIYPDAKVQSAIIEAADFFNKKLCAAMTKYRELSIGMIETERRPPESEIHL